MPDSSNGILRREICFLWKAKTILYTGGIDRERKEWRMIRAAHGRVAPEGVNEKMLTIRSHQHQPASPWGRRRRAEFVGKGNMEMNTLFSFWRMVSAESWDGAKSGIFSAAWTAERGGDIFLYYSTCRFAGVSLAGMASQHRTVIHQIGTDVAQSY